MVQPCRLARKKYHFLIFPVYLTLFPYLPPTFPLFFTRQNPTDTTKSGLTCLLLPKWKYPRVYSTILFAKNALVQYSSKICDDGYLKSKSISHRPQDKIEKVITIYRDFPLKTVLTIAYFCTVTNDEINYYHHLLPVHLQRKQEANKVSIQKYT